MEVYVLHVGNGAKEEIGVYSSKEKLLEGYLQKCKTFYSNHAKSVRESLAELRSGEYDLSDEVREDLINFVQEKEYKGLFSLYQLRFLDESFTFFVTKVDAKQVE